MKTTLTKTVSLMLASLGVAMALIACSSDKGPKLNPKPNVEIIQDMMDQPALKAQDYDPYTGAPAARLPPEGTVPQGYVPYKYKANPQGAAQNLKNPLSGDFSPSVLALGQSKYETYCLVCHGAKGQGDGPVAAKMALKPPPVVSDKIKTMPDGGIYHIITDGQGVMSSYAYQLVNERDRWAIVNYVRSLQRLSGGGSQ